jgi:hypothetical protein
MKTVIITGGCGGLGYFLTDHYIGAGWRVIIVDAKPDWDINPFGLQRPFTLDDPDYSDDARVLWFGNIGPTMAYKPDLIIHCAEENDPSHSLMEHAIHSNLTFHWNVLNHAAKFGVRTVVPMWHELNFSRTAHTHSKDPWIQCMRLRDQLLRHFDKGNTLISPVYMARLVSLFSTANRWGSLVKRFYDATVCGNIVVETTEEEVSNGMIQWMTPKAAVAAIVDAAEHRSRRSFFATGHTLSAQQLLAFIFGAYGKDFALIPTRGGFEIGTEPLVAENQEAVKMVAEACDDWTKLGL